jgi:5-methylcytosine-specific restriction endonuclease McrA
VSKQEEIEAAWAQHIATQNQRWWEERKVLTPALRNRLAEAQNWRCCYCGIRMMGEGQDHDAPTFEHIIPRALGGKDEEGNVAIACHDCNSERRHEMHPIHLRTLACLGVAFPPNIAIC